MKQKMVHNYNCHWWSSDGTEVTAEQIKSINIKRRIIRKLIKKRNERKNNQEN